MFAGADEVSVFGVFEERVAGLRELAENKKGRLRLLHAAVSLLHRLVRPASVALKGRVLLFLAKALPLSDKSGTSSTLTLVPLSVAPCS